MRILVAATGDFAMPTFRGLADGGHVMVGLITQPDRPSGRGRQVHVAAVKQAALDAGIPVMQPERIAAHDVVARVAEMAPEVFLVIAYGQKIPEEICGLPPKGAINLHGSLLPELRGAAPCNWAIINGLKRTGVSVMYLAPRMDAGDVLGQREVTIGPRETAGELHDRLAALGARVVLDVLEQLDAGTHRPIVQDETKVTLAPRLTKADGLIDWSLPASRLDALIRGLSPWPGAFTFLKQSGRDDLRVIVEQASPVADCAVDGEEPGAVVQSGRQLLVATGEGVLEIAQVKPQSSRSMAAEAFCNGHQVGPGDRFGLPIDVAGI
ncbi:MAG: methionyl-tRNA formyltransferase [Planctomycetes bacterium]|nr:methionyl-tRNA formyltransferase [Planctomycetota bacterium]